MKKLTLLFIVCALVLTGCCEEKTISETPTGKIISANAIPTNEHYNRKMQITTDKGTFIIFGNPYILNNQETKLRILNDGRTRLCIGEQGCYLMVR